MKINRTFSFSEENIKWLQSLNGNQSQILDDLLSKERIRLSKTPEEEYIEAWRKLEAQSKNKEQAESLKAQRVEYLERRIKQVQTFIKNSGGGLPANQIQLKELMTELETLNKQVVQDKDGQ